MATVSGPKKARVVEHDLPYPIVFDDLTYGYLARYRIVSEDQNRFSHYSPTYTVNPNYLFERPSNKLISDVLVISNGPYVNVVWDPITIKDRVSGDVVRKAIEYDLWLRWDKDDGGVWEFQERVQGTAQGFRIPDDYTLTNGTVVAQAPNKLSVEIYLRSSNPFRASPNQYAHPLLVFKLDGENI